jgi:hypothetical protein
MKNTLIAGFAIIALAVFAAQQSGIQNDHSTIACGGSTNVLISCGGCGGGTNNLIACGGGTNELIVCGGSTNELIVCGGSTNSLSCALALR